MAEQTAPPPPPLANIPSMNSVPDELPEAPFPPGPYALLLIVSRIVPATPRLVVLFPPKAIAWVAPVLMPFPPLFTPAETIPR